MAKVIGRNARILLGNRNVSPDVNQAVLTLEAEAPECTGFCDSYRVRLSEGVRNEELQVDGFYNNSACTMDDVLSANLAGSALTGIYFTGLAGSKFGREFNGIVTNYEPNFAVADAAAVSFTVSGSSSLYHMASLSGSSVDACQTPVVSAVGSSTMGSIDQGTGILGAIVTLRLLTLTGTTPVFSASVQYSQNDSSFTTAQEILNIVPADIGDHSSSMFDITSASRYARAIVKLAGTSPCATFVIATGSARTN